MVAQDFFGNPLVLASVMPVEPQPVNVTPCISRNERWFWSKARLFFKLVSQIEGECRAESCGAFAGAF